MKKILFISFFLTLVFKHECIAQDPAFSQFFSSPLNINPGLTGYINGDWRFISNLRDQWIGPASPYTTGTTSFDSKIFQNHIPFEPEKNFMGAGAMLMYDNAMSGIQRSMYGSLNLAYNLALYQGETSHRLSAGFGATYYKRTIDYTRVNFERQWIGLYGFDTNLPTGEPALYQMKGNVSVNAGLVYSFQSDKSNLDIGVAGFHLNKPKQTFIADPHQFLEIRKVAHANFETFLNNATVLNMNFIYQQQAETFYYSGGASLGYFVGADESKILNAGVWYWSNNAIIPYVGLAYGQYQFGFSSDITISELNKADRKPFTWELSLIIRGQNKPSRIIPCPWK
ncbi:MAG: PorP/SprF family type IX secretion system membrane protein [Candidatus Dadabacteria bacterium]